MDRSEGSGGLPAGAGADGVRYCDGSRPSAHWPTRAGICGRSRVFNGAHDEGLHKEIVTKMQMFDFYEERYTIPAFVNSLDAYRTRLRGYWLAKVVQPLSNTDFMNFWFA